MSAATGDRILRIMVETENVPALKKAVGHLHEALTTMTANMASVLFSPM